MNMDVATAIMSIRVSTDQCLMAGKMILHKFKSQGLCFLASKMVFVFIARIKTDDIVMGLDFVVSVVFSILVIEHTRFAQKIKEAQDKIQEIREKKQEALKHDTLLPTWLEEFKQYEHIKTLERRVVVELIDHIDVHSKTEIEIHFCFEDELHSITEKFMEYQAHHGNEVAEE